ncbi:MAG: hypothetical protein WBE46_09010 [Dehalococcoidia bacterium]
MSKTKWYTKPIRSSSTFTPGGAHREPLGHSRHDNPVCWVAGVDSAEKASCFKNE